MQRGRARAPQAAELANGQYYYSLRSPTATAAASSAADPPPAANSYTPQMAAAAATASYVFSITRWASTTSTIVASNAASGTPTIAANSIVQGILGYKLRIVAVSGASTSAGATQTILATCSDT